ncbi:secreted RxLR effector protein 161-like [Drosophila rhopaloa]|uniref:Reverse transcriptase Ty1/copia-type domain-containing protein n=1 Tax=Drosophila rhopaloa TaxID=1041015 RepID=A0ABM5J8Q9_DRORH|nr:secreted RxLR effector protein 161-like [Drosophila rhopaloa]
MSFIVVYVDDIIVASDSKAEQDEIKYLISKRYDVVDGGFLKHILGMEIDRDGEVGHKQYIEALLEDYGMQNCKASILPLEAGYEVRCSKKECLRANQVEYQSLIGSLMYLAITTRPDILHSVAKLAQRNSDPHQEHMVCAKRILRYLQGTKTFQLNYQQTRQAVYCYVDADWDGDDSDRKSFTSWTFLVAGAAISGESKKQPVVALSTTEAEYIALSSAAKEAVYIRKLWSEMGLGEVQPIIIHSDN